MGSRRCTMYLDLRYEGEKEVYEVIKSAPSGDGSAFIRSLVLIGFLEMERQKALSQPAEIVAEADKNEE